ncbi:MAG TPA: hypothetical protein VL576_02855 [Candidatus Paceibacterota bacterium]|jgi:hypothetical protein|nr:hypothetical protein [Candidatus Paceibacterota bacterium]
MEENEIDHIAELEKRLYARDPENVPKRTFGILRPERESVSSMWGQTTVPKPQSVHKSSVGGYRRFFIFSLIFFLIALGVAAYSIYKGSLTLSSKNVNVSILGNSFVAAGNSLPLQVEVANSNSASLINVKLEIDYPKGANDGTDSDTVRVQKDLGTINAGQSKSQDFSVVLYGQQGTSQTITAILSYKLKDSSATFQKQDTFAVMISSSPLTMTINGPTSIAGNQPFQLTINNNFTSDTPLSNVIARVEYPSGFVFSSANPAPSGGNNNVWSLGDLENGTNRTITIQGKLIGDENEQKSFRVYVGTPVSATDTTLSTVYNSGLHTVTLAQPFINAQMNINTQTSDVAAIPVGDPISGLVLWTNNSADTITNPSFIIALNGTSIDKTTVTATNGYYDPASNTITWNTDSDPDLATIAPGQSGQLKFSFKPTANDTSDSTADLSVSGTLQSTSQQQSITNIDSKTIRYSAHLQFASQAFFSVGPFKNTGPFPPKAGQSSTYTITWTARPSENALTNVSASAVLPLGTNWVGTTAPPSSPVTYDTATRTVTWNAGVLPKASASTAGQASSVSFQVSVKPTRDQVGQALQLLGTTTIVGTDSTVNVPLSTTRPALTTSLSSDPVYSQGKEKVVQ